MLEGAGDEGGLLVRFEVQVVGQAWVEAVAVTTSKYLLCCRAAQLAQDAGYRSPTSEFWI